MREKLQSSDHSWKETRDEKRQWHFRAIFNKTSSQLFSSVKQQFRTGTNRYEWLDTNKNTRWLNFIRDDVELTGHYNDWMIISHQFCWLEFKLFSYEARYIDIRRFCWIHQGFWFKCSPNAYRLLHGFNILLKLFKSEQQLQTMEAIRTKISKNLKHSSTDVCPSLNMVQRARLLTQRALF